MRWFVAKVEPGDKIQEADSLYFEIMGQLIYNTRFYVIERWKDYKILLLILFFSKNV